MVPKKIKTKYSSSSWEKQQEWEDYLRRMSTSQTVETDECCDTLNVDSVKRNKSKSKKLKTKKKGRHLSSKAETLLCNDNGFEASVKRKKAKKLKKHKDKHQKQKKNEDKSELPDSCFLQLPVKQKKDKKIQGLDGSTQISLSDQCAETLASQEIRFSESRRAAYGSFRSQHLVSEGSYNLKQQPAHSQSHIHPKSMKCAPYRKGVVLDSSFEYVSSKMKKHEEGTEHMEAPEPSPSGACGKEMLLKSILVSRKAHVTFEGEEKTLDPLRESDSKASQVTADNNSQELFITQKTFLPAESSSEESSGAVVSFTDPRDGQRCGVCPQLSQELFIFKSTTEKATQTDDFFSSPVLSTSFRFQKLHQKQDYTEQALDLSMSKRPHREPTGSIGWQVKQENEEPSCDPLYPKLMSTISNEQNKMLTLSKAGNAQLKVVQTRLNESFFFKMKGGGKSPKPQSPLLDHGMTPSKILQMKMSIKARRPSDLN